MIDRTVTPITDPKELGAIQKYVEAAESGLLPPMPGISLMDARFRISTEYAPRLLKTVQELRAALAEARDGYLKLWQSIWRDETGADSGGWTKVATEARRLLGER